VTFNFDHEYYQTNGTTLQNDDGGAHNSPESPMVVMPRNLTSSEMPQFVNSSASSSKRWDGFRVWTWTAPMLSSTVLQFDP